jgi:hypothetical protein
MARISFLAGALAVVALTGSVIRPATAGAVTITASFVPIRVTARPGELVTTNYSLKVAAGEPSAHFKADVQDWWRSEDGRQSFYAAPGALGRSCGKWVAATPREAAVAGGETLQVRLTISVPPDVKPGGYWCALTVDELPDPLAAPPDGVGVRFLASVSTGVYVYVNPIERGAEILSVDVTGDRAVLRIQNTGNTPVTVEGRYEFVRPGDARPTAIVEVPRNTLLTEPIATGAYSVDLPPASTLPSGRYLVRLILDIGADHYIGAQKELEIERAAIRPPSRP